jgi:hypothetical protein
MELHDNHLDHDKRPTGDPSPLSNALLVLGYVSAIPALCFALIILCLTITIFVIEGFPFSRDVTIPEHIRWPLAMAAFFIGFIALSTMRRHLALRIVMYLTGATATFCAAIYYAWVAVRIEERDHSSYGCGFLGVARSFEDLGRVACVSTFAAVLMISIAVLVKQAGIAFIRKGPPPESIVSDPLD